MVQAKDIVEQLTIEKVETILERLGAEPKRQGNKIISRTVCHNHAHEGKRKLEFYGDSKMFQCYTECHALNIFQVVMQSLDVDFKTAISFICETAQIDMAAITGFHNGFKTEMDKDLQDFFNRFKIKEIEPSKPFEPLDENILYYYYPYYHESWIKDGISIETMRKFGIRFDIENNRIIIPHRDIEGHLIGVRARFLNPEVVEERGKYAPILHKGKILLNHAIGNNLYGIFENKKEISDVKIAILMESEKGVMQLNSLNMPFGVAMSGSNLSMVQISLLRKLGVSEVIVGVDKEFKQIGDELEQAYAMKVKKSLIEKLNKYFKVSVLWDRHNLLDYKDSPTDKGKEVFEQLLRERIFI